MLLLPHCSVLEVAWSLYLRFNCPQEIDEYIRPSRYNKDVEAINRFQSGEWDSYLYFLCKMEAEAVKAA